MPFTSTVTFTLDTICPWTYLAKRRLAKALSQVSADAAAAHVAFTVVYRPYQLYPDAPQAGEDKYAWYMRSRYGGSEERMQMYTTLMRAYGVAEGIEYKFGGTVANTLQAHRVLQHFQEARGAQTADALVDSLYRQYFEEEKHPSSRETLLAATEEAGIEAPVAAAFIEDADEGLLDTKLLIREQAGNGIDAVPYVVLEGKRRDITLEGCREVDDYVKALRQIIKESQ